MKRISEVANQELEWVQPSARQRAYELRAGDEVVATLVWQRSSLASAETEGESWTFKREGLWHPRVTVRRPDSEQNEAIFQPSWSGGGSLALAPGRELRLVAANFWHSEWLWQGAMREPLVDFKGPRGCFKSGAAVAIISEAAALPELDLLVVLGWYLLVLFAEDASAASAASVATMGAV